MCSKKGKFIELGGLIDQNLMFQNHYNMTRVKDLEALIQSYYLGFQFSGANFPMNKTFMS